MIGCLQLSHEHFSPFTDTAKSGELLQQLSGNSVPAPIYSFGFCGLLAAMCFGLRPAQLDKANTVLLGAVFASFAVSCFSCMPGDTCAGLESRKKPMHIAEQCTCIICLFSRYYMSL